MDQQNETFTIPEEIRRQPNDVYFSADEVDPTPYAPKWLVLIVVVIAALGVGFIITHIPQLK